MTDNEKVAHARRLEDHYRQTKGANDEAREARNAYVRELVAEGWTHAHVSGAFGFSRARVAQIAPRKRQGKTPA